MTVIPLCFECKHLDPACDHGGKYRCAAFPDGIPAEILLCEFLHYRPYPGDHGIRFEPADGPESSPAPSTSTGSV